MQTDSAALCTLRTRPTDVPAHAIAGNYIPTVDDLADLSCAANTLLRQPAVGAFCKGWRLLKLAGFETGVSTNFPLGGDLVVGLDSQRDGFGDGSSQVTERDHIHMDFADHPWALGTDTVADRAVELLNASPHDGSLFGTGFPVSACSQQMTSQRPRSAATAPAAALTGLIFTSPADGSTVTPGQVVTVTIQPDAGVTLTDLMLNSLGDVQQRTGPPWEFALTIPASVVGPFALSAVGKDAAGQVYGAAVSVNVVPASPLHTLGVAPANLTIADAGLPYSLAVIGHYEDGTQRDLTAAATGTTYTSQAPTIATVDAAGQVTPQANGTTMITVTHGPVSALVPVVVQLETDLAIQQTATPSPVAPGADLTVAIAVTNQGQTTAREVQVESRLPANSVFVSASGNGWGCIEAGGTVNCYRDSLAAGAAATINLVFQTPASCQSIDSQVAVNAGTPDGHADNNVSVVTTPCAGTTFVLTLAKAGTYATGAPVTLTATADTGSTFAGWSPSPCAASFTMPASDLTCTATFTATVTPITYTLSIAKAGTGSGTVGGGGTYTAGAPVTLTATADAGSTFAGWSPSPCANSFAMPASDLTCTATFALNTTYALTLTKTGTGSGTVGGGGTYAAGAPVTLTATADAGSTFTGWSPSPCAASFTMPATALTCAATFTHNTYAITATVEPAAGGTASCSPNPVDHGGTSLCTATPSPGYTFMAWSGDCTGASCLLANVTAAKRVTATFGFAIVTSVTPAGSGTVSCTVSLVAPGGTSLCTATANPGFSFTGWRGDCAGQAGKTCTLSNINSAKVAAATFVEMALVLPSRGGWRAALGH